MDFNKKLDQIIYARICEYKTYFKKEQKHSLQKYFLEVMTDFQM